MIYTYVFTKKGNKIKSANAIKITSQKIYNSFQLNLAMWLKKSNV